MENTGHTIGTKSSSLVVINEVMNSTQLTEIDLDVIVGILKNYTNSKIDNILGYIQLGVKLVDMKKRLGNEFYNVVTDDVLAKKRVQEAMHFVLSVESNTKFAKAMQVVSNPLETQKKLKLFKFNTRIIELTAQSLENMIKPSVSKFKEMIHFSDEDFNTVLSGDDAPLEVLKEKVAVETKAVDKYKYKPEGISDSEYDDFHEAGFDYILASLLVEKTKNESSEDGLEIPKIDSLEVELETPRIEDLEKELELAKNKVLEIKTKIETYRQDTIYKMAS